MDRKHLQNLKVRLNENAISLEKFLKLNYGIRFIIHGNDKNLKITHGEIKLILPCLISVSFEELDIEELYRGDIIAVRDSYGKINLYKTPKIDIEQIDIVIDNYNHKEDVPDSLLLNKMSVSNLAFLCNKFKKNNQMQDYKDTYKILKEKKKIKRKGRDEFYEY